MNDLEIREFVKKTILTGNKERIAKVMERYKKHLKERGQKLNEVRLSEERRYDVVQTAKKIFFGEEKV